MPDHGRIERLRSRVVEGPIAATIVYLATPIVAARILGSIQESVDAMFLGRVSTQDLAAPTAAWPLIWLFMGINFGVTTATISIVSQLIGAKRFREASESAGKLLGLSLVLASISLAVIVVAAPFIFRLQGIPESVFDYALAYTYIDVLAIPFMFMMFYFNSLSSSMGDTRTPFKISALASVINIVLDPILIFGLGPLPRMGVIGAALATTISRIITGGLALYLLLSGKLGFTVYPRIPDRHLALLALRTGGPVAGQQIFVSSGFLVMMGIVARLGDVVMAAYNLSLAIIHIIQAATMGFNLATATMVGQNLGAGKIDRAVKAARTGLGLVAGILAAGAIFIIVFRGPVVAVFTDIPEVAAEAEKMIGIVAIGMPFLGTFFVANGVARGSGWTGIMSLLGVARLWLIRIPLAYLLVFEYGMGSDGVWWAMTASNVTIGLAGAVWALSGGWAKPIIREKAPEAEKAEAIPPYRVPGGR